MVQMDTDSLESVLISILARTKYRISMIFIVGRHRFSINGERASVQEESERAENAREREFPGK